MSKILDKIKNYELYCGLTKEQYDLVKEDITISALSSLKLFSILGSIATFILFIMKR